MQTPLYAIDGNSSLGNSQNPSRCAKNRLDLLPEHIAEIGNAFILQISISRLPAQDTRILSAIYSQTIGYNKCEDDMNGGRLEQLTAIRSDHANEAVRRLEALNVIITRPGHYGKWMSINFNFSQWGEKCSEPLSNDPRCLLSERYQPLVPENELPFQVHQIPDSCKPAPFVKPPTANIEQQQSTAPVLNHNHDHNPVQSETKQFAKPSTGTEQQQSTAPALNHDHDHNPVQSETKQSATPSAPSTLSTPFELHFPDAFSKNLRESIMRHLKGIKILQQAQRLLDYFAQCLLKGNILNPVGYFIELKKRLLKGQLDLPEDAEVIKKKKKVNQELVELRLEYQEAVADYEQMKTLIQTFMETGHCTFDKALRKIGYNDLWKEACRRLEAIKKALKIYHRQSLA